MVKPGGPLIIITAGQFVWCPALFEASLHYTNAFFNYSCSQSCLLYLDQSSGMFAFTIASCPYNGSPLMKDYEGFNDLKKHTLQMLRVHVHTDVQDAGYMLWFKFTSSSNFFKLVHIFQTSLYFSNLFIFIKLVHIFQTGLKFLNQFNFQF